MDPDRLSPWSPVWNPWVSSSCLVYCIPKRRCVQIAHSRASGHSFKANTQTTHIQTKRPNSTGHATLLRGSRARARAPLFTRTHNLFDLVRTSACAPPSSPGALCHGCATSPGLLAVLLAWRVCRGSSARAPEVAPAGLGRELVKGPCGGDSDEGGEANDKHITRTM